MYEKVRKPQHFSVSHRSYSTSARKTFTAVSRMALGAFDSREIACCAWREVRTERLWSQYPSDGQHFLLACLQLINWNSLQRLSCWGIPQQWESRLKCFTFRRVLCFAVIYISTLLHFLLVHRVSIVV